MGNGKNQIINQNFIVGINHQGNSTKNGRVWQRNGHSENGASKENAGFGGWHFGEKLLFFVK
jgi:hypothetical protein